METRHHQKEKPAVIRTPVYRLRIFVSSTLKELAEEREATRRAILNIRRMPVMFESGARHYRSGDLVESLCGRRSAFHARGVGSCTAGITKSMTWGIDSRFTLWDEKDSI